MFPVVDSPFCHNLDVLQRGTQVLKLSLQRLLREAVRAPSVGRRHLFFNFYEICVFHRLIRIPTAGREIRSSNGKSGSWGEELWKYMGQKTRRQAKGQVSLYS